MFFDQDLDGSGGVKKMKKSVKILEDICLEQDLIDIWRVRNPTENALPGVRRLQLFGDV